MLDREFSLRDLNVMSGVASALVAAGPLIAAPSVLFFLISDWYEGSLTHIGIETLSTFLLYALIIGAAIAFTAFLYGGYKKGTRPRLLFGMASAALVIVYSFIVLVASGFGSLLSDIGVHLDTAFPAFAVTYASVVIMFSVGGEYLRSRGTEEVPAIIVEAESGGAR